MPGPRAAALDGIEPIGRSRRRMLPYQIGGLLAIVAAVGYLIWAGLGSGSVYYLTVSEFQHMPPSAKPVRVSGNVVTGSIVRDGPLVRFAVADSSGRLPVVYKGVVPDIFGDDIQVVVEGRQGTDGSFEATTLLAKCPSKFDSAGGTGAAGTGKTA